jgi:hypothetical protein
MRLKIYLRMCVPCASLSFLNICAVREKGADLLYVPQLKETNDQLSALTNDAGNPPSQSMSRAIQRHRDVYQDYARELNRTKVLSDFQQRVD